MLYTNPLDIPPVHKLTLYLEIFFESINNVYEKSVSSTGNKFFQVEKIEEGKLTFFVLPTSPLQKERLVRILTIFLSACRNVLVKNIQLMRLEVSAGDLTFRTQEDLNATKKDLKDFTITPLLLIENAGISGMPPASGQGGSAVPKPLPKPSPKKTPKPKTTPLATKTPTATTPQTPKAGKAPPKKKTPPKQDSPATISKKLIAHNERYADLREQVTKYEGLIKEEKDKLAVLTEKKRVSELPENLTKAGKPSLVRYSNKDMEDVKNKLFTIQEYEFIVNNAKTQMNRMVIPKEIILDP
jgi:hypothetical protein